MWKTSLPPLVVESIDSCRLTFFRLRIASPVSRHLPLPLHDPNLLRYPVQLVDDLVDEVVGAGDAVGQVAEGRGVALVDPQQGAEVLGQFVSTTGNLETRAKWGRHTRKD